MSHKLFVFGIGGTGSRVIKSLTMLLASGVELKNVSEVIPIIIDPDKSNGDLSRTLEILSKYISVRKSLEEFTNNGFFKTKITTLGDLEAIRTNNESNPVHGNNFNFNLKGVDDETFGEFIDLEGLSSANQALMHMLFSDQNLAAKMEVGFKGNPNIGSVVLNQFKNSKEFGIFASNFEESDRIFIISSIFGGTGAAGFPLLLKNIRGAEREKHLPNKHFLTNAVIGAVTLLPYFGVESDRTSQIDKSTFVSKAKSALVYYLRNIIGNRSINAMYLLGDKVHKDYQNVEGAQNQKNDAHFMEMVAALGIMDFADMNDAQLNSSNGKSKNEVLVREFGIKEDVNEIHFKALGLNTSLLIEMALIQYRYFLAFLEARIEQSTEKMPWANKTRPYIDETFLKTNPFFTEFLSPFNKHFEDWITEMGNNKRSFKPFVPVTEDKLFEMVNGQSSLKGGLMTKKNWSFYEDLLNRLEKQLPDLKVEDKFMTLFYKATETIAEDKFNTQRRALTS